MSKNRYERTGRRPNWLSQPQRDIDSERSKMVDIDGVPFCHFCQTPIMMYEEETFWGRPITEKCVDVTRWFAVKCDLPAYVAQVHTAVKYESDDEEITSQETVIEKITVMRINPPSSKIVDMTVEEWQDHLMDHRDEHEKVCVKPSGLRWDKKLRKDVKLQAQAANQ